MSVEDSIAAAVERAVAPLVAEVRQLRQVVEQHGRFLTVADAAAQLEVSTRTLRRWISAGTISVVRRGRCIRVDLASVKATGAEEIANLAEQARSPKLRAVDGAGR